MSETNLDIAKRYLKAIEDNAPFEEVAAFFTEDVVQEEFPNRLMPNGARRGLSDMREGAARGRQVMSAQRYEVLRTVSEGDSVALEVQWIGTLAVPYGSIPVGGEMRARFGVFLDFRDGRICHQRNYDCFDPW